MARKLSIDAICRLIDALLPKGCPAIEDIAHLLRVSPRTLQRLLSEEGASYSGMVERCRRQTACDALEYTGKSVKDIATDLGYRDASSFTRAFRRWTGTAPRTYRQQLSGSQGERSRWQEGRAPGTKTVQ
jgi:AraC-like DNA-binding protein